MKKFFGTDGIRGFAGSEKMNEDLAFKLGKALIKYCRNNNIKSEIIIGRDTRISGPFLEAAVSRGVIVAGGKIISAGVIPTSAIAYLAKKCRTGLGLVVSASHNPYEHNGFKIFKNDGTKLNDAEEMEIEKLIINASGEIGGLLNHLQTAVEFKIISLSDYDKKYAEFLLDILGGENLKGMKIVLDCANGATYKIAPYVFKNFGAEVKVISAAPDGKNINKDCGSEHTENLQKAVRENKADVGLAFDGDGDRLIAINEKGEPLTGDQMLYVCAKMLKEKGELKNNLVASTVMSNIGFVNGLKRLGISHLQADVGDQRVYSALVKSGAILGGEESGHIIFLDHHTTGDGILTGLMLLKAIKYFNKSLSELAGEVSLMPKVLYNVKIKNKPEFSAVPEINEIIKATEKYLGDEGRVLVRYSGTEPLCRIMVEGKNKKEIEALAEKIGGVIKNNIN